MIKSDFFDHPELIEEAQKINQIAMNYNRSASGPASWTNPRTSATYSVTSGGDVTLAKKIRNDKKAVFGTLDIVDEVNLKLKRQSGTTAQRPTSELAVGDTYLDTTLGKPIWYTGSGWVDAAGTSV